MSKDNQFKLQINLTKAYKDEDGNAFVEGIASGPEVDLTGERMSETALKSMVESIYKRLIELRDAHRDEWNDDLGEVVELSLTDDNHLFYKAKLDLKLSGAQDLWYRLTELKRKLGVSIGGSIVKAGWEYVAELGREVFTYFDVDLYEISITRQAAYQYSFANAVLKSLLKKEESMTKSEQTEVEKTEVEKAHQDINLTESEAAATADATEEAQDATQTESEGEEATQEESEEAAAEADAEPETDQDAESAEGEVEKSTDADEQTEAAGDEATEVKEVAKAAVLGSWAEADVAYEAINSLSWNLRWFVWDVVIDSDKSPEERQALIAAALTEFSRIVQSVASALIESGVSDEMAKSAEAERAQTPESLAKTLTETTSRADKLQKSLDAKTTELESASKELEDTKKSLAEKETELEKHKTRKAIVFGKFTGQEAETESQQDVVKASNEKFASFIIHGAR